MTNPPNTQEALRKLLIAIEADQNEPGHRRQAARAAILALSLPKDAQPSGESEPFGYFRELLNPEGKGTGVWLGCPNKKVAEQSYIENETGTEIVTLYRSPQPKAVDAERDAKDAAMWRALLGSARIRPIGSAGLDSELNPYGEPWNGYAHLGLELWTVFGKSLNDEQRERLTKENALGREWLTKYVEIAAMSQAQGGE